MRLIKSIFAFLLLSISILHSSAQGVYAPAAGQPGSTAIHTDSSIIKSWATGIELYRGWVQISDTSVKYNGSNKATFAYPSIALGKAQESSYDVVSLGDGGIATLTFDRPIVNGLGADFTVFENGFSDTFLELAFLEVSSDGVRFVRFPAVSLTPTTTQVGGFGALDPTNIHNLAGKYRQGYGTPFDLDDIKDSTNIDLNNIRFVRLIDVVGNIDDAYATYDSKGNKVNDPWATPFHSCGFDLDAIGIINAGQSYDISTLDELVLANDTYWYPGVDTLWGDGLTKFKFDADDNFERGFFLSNQRNDTIDQNNLGLSIYNAITKGGMNAADTGGTNYAVAQLSINWLGDNSNMPVEVVFKDDKSETVSGFYVTNSTYAYISMIEGDMFAKKFGGATGNDPDYFKILIWGEKEDGSKTDTIDFYLADFRFSDNSKDYIVNNWRWVDVSKLGKVKKLQFNLESSDVGTWGMNTPNFFCLDNLTVIPDALPNNLQLANPIADVSVDKNASPKEINLTGVFSANDLTGLVLSVASNTNTSLVSTAIIDNKLTLTFTPEQTGEANIVIQAQLGSQIVTDTFNVKVNTVTGIEQNLAQTFKVYPNPFNSQLSVECSIGNTVMIFDVFGRKLLEEKATSNVVQLTTGEFKQGYYIIKMSGNNGVQSIKVLKQ